MTCPCPQEADAALGFVDGFLVFIEGHIVSLIFAVFFFSLIVFLLKLNFGNGSYKHFKLAQMVAKEDGSLDRKAMERVGLYMMSMYGFLHVLHKVPDQIVTYFSLMATIWLGAHVLGTVANKLPDRGNVPKEPS
jgi:hypothetical protein